MIKSYNLAMLWIFICFGFVIMDTLGAFGSFSEQAGVYGGFAWLTNPIFEIPGIGLKVTGVIALSVAMALATIVILQTNVINDRGIAYAIHTLVFWGSFVSAFAVMDKIDLPGIEMFYGFFFIVSTLIFIFSLTKFPVGGEG